MSPGSLLPQLLFLFGVGFCAANLKVIADLIRFRIRKSSALLVWKNPKPPFYRFAIALGVVLGLLVVFEIVVLGRPPNQLFGFTIRDRDGRAVTLRVVVHTPPEVPECKRTSLMSENDGEVQQLADLV